MAIEFRNSLYQVVTGYNHTTGEFTLSSAISGYRGFVSGDDGQTFIVSVRCNEGNWELLTATYTSSGTKLTRVATLDSSSGSAIDFSAKTAVRVRSDLDATGIQASQLAAQNITPGGRLTLTSSTPVTASDVTSTTLYYTPYTSNVLPLWDGKRWKPVEFAEVSLALGTLTTGLPYDVFGRLSSGALALEKLAWTNGTTRATAVTLQDGRYCKSGDQTRLYLGTFYSSSTTQTTDSFAQRFLWNMYNQVDKSLRSATGSSHTLNNVGPREWNNGAGTLPRSELICGRPSGAVASIWWKCRAYNTAAQTMNVLTGIYLDGVLVNTSQNFFATAQWVTAMQYGNHAAVLAAGYHVLSIGEQEYASQTTTLDGGTTGAVWQA